MRPYWLTGIVVLALMAVCTGCSGDAPTAEAAGDAKRPDLATPGGKTNPANVGPAARTRRAVRAPGQALDISFDDLEFEIERDAPFSRDMLTSEIEALAGTRVKIYGFILPASVFRQTGIDRFVLVRDNQECCFGPGAYIYHNIQVEMAEGRSADFSVRPVAVDGELHIRPWHGPDGKCYSVFHMTAERVGK